ncbi:MAG: patatin-like phospholipase family protein [Nitrospinae bacterium]|nr:patatin-like phospholipase family protein [Nitrospinota bacterium]
MSRHRLKITWLAIALFVLSCKAFTPAPETIIAPKKPKVALVLGGGAARGLAHVGVIRVLEQEKIPIDLIIGTSVGSLIGAVYASHANSFELEWEAFKVTKDDIFDFTIISSRMGPVKGDRIEEFVNKVVPVKNIEEMRIPFIAIATDLNTGEMVIIDKGPVAKAVHASSAIPGVFHPVNYLNKTLVDGGVVDNVAVDVARQKGADIVIAVDVSGNVVNYEINNLFDISLQAVNIMGNEIAKFKIKDADVIITPHVGDVKMLDFDQKKRCMTEGIAAAQAGMPKIKNKIDEWLKKNNANAASKQP